MRKHPNLFEANALIFLRRLSAKYGRPLTLLTIPDNEWKELAEQGFDLLWLMGVWKRSPGARECALHTPELRHAYDLALPGWKEEDVVGSPYAVYSYSLEPRLGGENDLAELKVKLNSFGLGLILDYVPNHLALDHPWTKSKPDCFIEGSREDFQGHPGLFFKTHEGKYFAHGKDPYFSAWKDTVQINFFSGTARQAAVETLLNIAGKSAGVRCDMAMLGLNRVFENTWGDFLEEISMPRSEFWSEVIEEVKSEYPDFIFIAEAYWDLEWELQQIGFDFTYDKKLYDRLLHSAPEDIRGHLKAELSYQNKSMRFSENHDEPRAAAAFGSGKSYAAAVAAATVPGLHLFYDGQTTGKKIRLLIQLGREPEEKEDKETAAFYKLLLNSINQETCHKGEWQMIPFSPAWAGNINDQSLLAWAWHHDRKGMLVIINYSSVESQARIHLPEDWIKNDLVVFYDKFSDNRYERHSKELRDQGLYVDLKPWKFHFFEFEC